MSNEIWFDPTSDKWALSDGEHYLEVPYWARGVIADEFERETGPLKTENAELRELVRRLYNMADFCRNCPDTERCDVDVEWLGCTVADPIDKLMDELGVDV